MDDRDLIARFAEAARVLRAEEDVQHTLHKAVTLALDMIPGCDHAGVSLVHRNQGIDTSAATSEDVGRADALQYELGEGPCLRAIWEDHTVASRDVAEDERWPTWGTRVAQVGMCSVLAFQLFNHRDTLGALNLYSARVDGFTDEDREEGSGLAAHVAVALSASREVENLYVAVSRRTTIGRAEGILMERFDIGAEEAFAVLRRVSQDTNTKLYEVADQLVSSRKTPGT
ncbi:MAG TPA: GAF and ANTAR domain-containing protein [Nocardioidaceae bacterium]|nr:GAF and ANTAR domain-containing protein [Nocardioidaceae bacterium]